MAREDTLTMTQKELKRLHVLHKVLDRRLTQQEASELLRVCTRQVRRMVERIRGEGDQGIIHRSCGKPSHNAINQKIKEKAIVLQQTHYSDFGPTLACEKLSEIHKITLSDETLRRWLIEKGIPYNSRKRRPHRMWRERKSSFGQMVQMDGSHHAWLEDRGPHLVLMAFTDDATGNVFGRFYEYEGTIPALDGLKRYVKRYGIPQSVYLDKHTTYKSNAKQTLEDELRGSLPLTQVGRALKELGVEIIYADSPQAKGRIERQFRTFQDRLVKELRLAKAKTVDEANRFLAAYLPTYNRRFRVVPANPTNLHRPLPKGPNLRHTFCIKEKRFLRNDQTLSYRTRLYQLRDPIRAKTLMVEEGLNGSIQIRHNATSIRFQEIKTRPKGTEAPRPSPKKREWITPSDHPWRRFKICPSIDNNEQKEKKELLLTHA